ncbi:2-amino-4-hydroxy-6-hydroxymethyldihydropteridine diphosphokinase [Legionella gresilensis]|uniref:2-amino-4-hydroxy-6- hydroxymethyldihydropteridine diphosphokinase n=1 Tax=Legionella gresilensis TaxID=91823 RepID=UPI001041B8A5|nr:2-amino-4-hydroxy-6-hydroxymethyldihydropteridine diphosphokinase [Legionella gresilensis]
MIKCYLALGSNLNSPERQLRLAIKHLQALPNSYVIKVAPFYANKAWGRKSQPKFYNTVVALLTTLPPEKLLVACQAIENKQGRVRRVKWGARTLDIDILLYDKKTIKKPSLTIPHPFLLYRDFVLNPLLKIAPFVCLPNGLPICKVIKI